jgi:hypothetical protein
VSSGRGPRRETPGRAGAVESEQHVRLARPVVDVARRSLRCRYPITGGLLARRPGGEIVFAQDRVSDQLRLRSTVTGFFPTLANRPGRPVPRGPAASR